VNFLQNSAALMPRRSGKERDSSDGEGGGEGGGEGEEARGAAGVAGDAPALQPLSARDAPFADGLARRELERAAAARARARHGDVGGGGGGGGDGGGGGEEKRGAPGGESSADSAPSSPSDASLSSGLLSPALARSDASAPAAARRGGRLRARHAALCAVGCCALTVLMAMLTICVAFTGRTLGPLAPLVVEVLTHLTGLTVADGAFADYVLRPPAARARMGEPARLLAQTGAPPGAVGARGTAPRPNVLIFLADDLGYSDPFAFAQLVQAHSNNTTPNLDRLAREGLSLTQFLTELICTPARAALLTGRYPARYGMSQDVLPQRVIFTPGAPTGLPRRELTIASALKAAGYRTGLTGKWHLGISAAPTDGSNGTNAFLPAAHGFDDSLVFPFSNFQKCDPYEGRTPTDPPKEQTALGRFGGGRARPDARAERRADRTDAHADSARAGHRGAPGEDADAPLLAREAAARAAAAQPPQGAQGAQGAQVHAEDVDDADAFLGGADDDDEDDELGSGGGQARADHRHERRDGRQQRQAASDADAARTAADAFAQTAGFEQSSSEYGMASNGLFCFLMANNTIVQQPADMLR
jgi:hypothetical protein